MPTALTPDERERRAKAQAQERERQAVEAWLEREQEAHSLAAETPDFLERRGGLTERQFWLLLAVTETEEKEHLVHKSFRSSETRWFDNIAPRARASDWGRTTGVAGFTTRLGAGMKDMLRLSRNGYVHATARSLAIVEYFRNLHPQLQLARAAGINSYEPLELPGFLTVPNLRWRLWEK